MNNLSEKLLQFLKQAINKRSQQAIHTFIKGLIEDNYHQYEAIARYNLKKRQKDFAKDVVQEMFTKMLEGGCEELVKLESYAPFIARELRWRVRRIALNFDRKSVPHNSTLIDPQDAKNETLCSSESLEKRLEAQDELEYLQKQLNPSEVKVFIAKASGYSHIEVGKYLGITPNASRQILSRARKKLNQHRDSEIE